MFDLTPEFLDTLHKKGGHKVIICTRDVIDHSLSGKRVKITLTLVRFWVTSLRSEPLES